MLAIGKNLSLQRQERSARVDEIDAGQAIVERDLLRADVLLDGDRVVGAAFDGGVVGDDQHLAARHAADPRHDAGRRRLVVVHPVGGERGELEERRTGVEQTIDALARRQLSLVALALKVFRAAAFAGPGRSLCELGDKLLHASAVGLEDGVGRIDASVEDYHPQQSVLKPHAGQRQTACMRYISAPQRSQSILASPDVVPGPSGTFSGAIGRGGTLEADMPPIISKSS